MRLPSSLLIHFRYLYCLCLSVSSLVSFSQPVIQYEQFTSENGLSENVVYCVFQDKKGFIWAGTDFGLNRFDGYRFRNYFKDNNDSTTISNNSVSSIEENTDGRLWIGTFAGLNLFDPLTGKAERIYMKGSGLNYGVSSVHVADKDHLLLLLGSTVYLFTISDRSFHIISKEKNVVIPHGNFFKFPGNRMAILASSNGESGFFVIDSEKYIGRFRPIRTVFPFVQTTGRMYYCQDSKGNHCFFENSGSFKMYSKTGDLICLVKAGSDKINFPEQVIRVTEVNNGDLWIAATNGIFVFDKDSREIYKPVLSGRSESLAANLHLNCITNSRNGNTWVGTFGEGLLKFENRLNIFRHIPLPDIRTDETKGMIMGIYQWQDNKVAATGRGGYVFFQDGKLTGYKKQNELLLDEIVAATTGQRLSVLNAWHQQKLKELYEQQRLIPHFFLLHDDTTLITFSNTFIVYHPLSTKKIFESQVFNMAKDDSSYWFATTDGLQRVDKKNFKDTLYRFEPGNKNSISESWTYFVLADESSHIWIGTKGGGLNQFDVLQNRFTHYTVDNGLPDNVVYVVLPDKLGRLWLTTNKGISVFNIREKTFTNFSKRDGLLNTEYNRLSGLLAQDGYMYFAGTAGIDYFDPVKIQSIATPSVYFSSIVINNEEMTSEQSDLKYFQNNLSISYTANDFNRPGLVYYRYRLKQAHPWTRVQGANSVSFNALPPGKYSFEVQSSYNNLLWSNSAAYTFIIKIPWWQSWWFYTLVAMTVATGLYLLYRYRIYQLKKVHKLRSKISQDLHDEVGATLSSIHVYSSVAARVIDKDTGKAIDALQQINNNTRLVMENMSDIVWAINTNNTGDTSLSNKLKNYGYEMLTPLNINCVYKIDKEAEKKLVNMEARKNILMIAKEAMNNIAKYSNATEAIVRLELIDKNLELEIADNGKGLPKDNNRTGNGMVNMKQRTEALGGNFSLSSGENKGTTILCHIPVANISD